MTQACRQSSCLCPVRLKMDSFSLLSSQNANKRNYSPPRSLLEPFKICPHQDSICLTLSVSIVSLITAAPAQPRAWQSRNNSRVHNSHASPSVLPSAEWPLSRVFAISPPRAAIIKSRAPRFSSCGTGSMRLRWIACYAHCKDYNQLEKMNWKLFVISSSKHFHMLLVQSSVKEVHIDASKIAIKE